MFLPFIETWTAQTIYQILFSIVEQFTSLESKRAAGLKSNFVLLDLLIRLLVYCVSRGVQTIPVIKILKTLDGFNTKSLSLRRKHVVECVCYDARQWSTVISLYEERGVIYRVVIMHLAHITRALKLSECEETKAMLKLLQSQVFELPGCNLVLRKRNLQTIICTWIQREHETDLLEAVLAKSFANYGKEISDTLLSKRCLPYMKGHHKCHAEYFSSSMCFKVCVHRLHENTGTHYGSNLPVPGNREEINSNLVKDANVIFSSLIHPEEIICASRLPFVIFTCGHIFSRLDFQKSTLYRLKEDLNALKFLLPATFSIILSEYEKESMSLLCPICLVVQFSYEDDVR